MLRLGKWNVQGVNDHPVLDPGQHVKSTIRVGFNTSHEGTESTKLNSIFVTEPFLVNYTQLV